MSKKDPEKALSPGQWQKMRKRLQKKVKKQLQPESLKLRKNLTEEESKEIKGKTGRPLSTMDGFVNSLSSRIGEDNPLPEKTLSPKQSLSSTKTAGEPLPVNTIPKEIHTVNSGKQEQHYNSNKTLPQNKPFPTNNSNTPSCSPPPRSPAGHPLKKEPTDVGYGLYSPERNSFDMLKLIQSGNMDATELTVDERVIIVRSLKLMGRTQDEISAMMRVSRRMVERDYKRIRQMDKNTLMSYDLEELGGEIHALCMHAAQAALKDKKFFSVPKILESMTTMLQSMGLVYKAPAKSQVAAMVGVAHTQVGQRAYHKYQDSIEGERDKVLDVLSKMLTGVQENAI